MTLSEIWSLPWQLRSKSKFHLCNLRTQLLRDLSNCGAPGPGFHRLWSKLPVCRTIQVPPAFWICTTAFVDADLVIVYLITYLHAQLLSLGTFTPICICKSWLELQQNDCTCKLQSCPFINPGSTVGGGGWESVLSQWESRTKWAWGPNVEHYLCVTWKQFILF